jgi:hypothetical protein
LLAHARFRERLPHRFPPARWAINATNGALGLWDDGNRWCNGVHKHAPATEVRRYLGATRYDAYFKFAFMRNPWDWQVSVYHYVRNSPLHHEHRFATTHGFPEFLERRLAASAPCQLDFLCDEHGDVIVDRIGRFESLDRDLTEICERLHLPEPPLAHLNRSPDRRQYRAYYDSASAALVARHFRRDIEYGGYDF